MTKAKKTKVKKTVRGPQLNLKGLGVAKPKDGNPFFALRVPAGLLRAFQAHAKSKGKEATTLVREHMAKATGFKLAVADAK